MRNHLTLKQIAACINVRETYAGQAFDPALTKVADVFIEYPDQALALLAERVSERRREKAQEMEREIAARERMLEGRANRRDVNPQPTLPYSSVT